MSQSHDDFFNKMKGAQAVNAKHPFIEHGRHRLAVEEYIMYPSPTNGRTLSATFRVLASDKHEVGSCVSAIWQPERPPMFKGDDGSQERNKAADFIGKLLGKDDPAAAGATIAQLIQNQAKQLIKGMVIDCVGAFMPPRPKRDGTMGKGYTNLTWYNVKQTREDIAAQRARLESAPAVATAAPTLPETPAPAPELAPTPQPVASTGPSLLDDLV